METVKEKQAQAFTALKDEFALKNIMSSPKITKVVINSGTGRRMKVDRMYNDLVSDRLAQITGQKPSIRPAKKSVAGFKIRTGDPVGQVVTLRGERMYAFLDKLINIALPRTKDFRGIKRETVDEMGNITISIKESSIFPELSHEDLKDIFGLGVTIVTTAKNKKEAIKFFELIGVPFAKAKK
jgi:large subunit ribosomal protein L5